MKKQEQRTIKKSNAPEKARNAKRTSPKTTNNDRRASLSDLYEERADGLVEPAPEKKSIDAKKPKSAKTAMHTEKPSAADGNVDRVRTGTKTRPRKTQTVQNAAKAEKTKRAAKPADKKTSVQKKSKTKKRTDGVGVTENAPYSHLADYRMITTADDVANSSGS